VGTALSDAGSRQSWEMTAILSPSIGAAISELLHVPSLVQEDETRVSILNRSCCPVCGQFFVRRSHIMVAPKVVLPA
jgi:hypothetical protein